MRLEIPEERLPAVTAIAAAVGFVAGSGASFFLWPATLIAGVSGYLVGLGASFVQRTKKALRARDAPPGCDTV